MNTQRIKLIQERLHAALPLAELQVEDESHLHIGHAGAKDGRGHFRVRVVSDAFTGKPPLQRHRLVYNAVGSLMDTDIHALSIEASTPVERQQAMDSLQP